MRYPAVPIARPANIAGKDATVQLKLVAFVKAGPLLILLPAHGALRVEGLSSSRVACHRSLLHAGAAMVPRFAGFDTRVRGELPIVAPSSRNGLRFSHQEPPKHRCATRPTALRSFQGIALR